MYDIQETVTCNICDGTGKLIKRRGTVACRLCNGTGFITVSRTEGKKFGVRAVAFSIDMIINIVISYVWIFVIAIVVVMAMTVRGEAPNFVEQSSFWYGFLIGSVRLLLYFVSFEALFGATPGKLILSMRVVQENGEPCGFGPAIIRGILRHVDAFPFFGIIALYTMKWPLYQRVGDSSAKTIVVGAADPIIETPRHWSRFIAAAVIYLALAAIVSFAVVAKMFQ